MGRRDRLVGVRIWRGGIGRKIGVDLVRLGLEDVLLPVISVKYLCEGPVGLRLGFVGGMPIDDEGMSFPCV